MLCVFQKTGNAIRALGRMTSLQRNLGLSSGSLRRSVSTENGCVVAADTNQKAPPSCDEKSSGSLKREQDREEYLKQEEPSFAGKVKDVKADEGQDAKFKAKYKGYPEPTVTWHRDGTQLESGDRYRVKTKQGLSTLTIEEVEEKDNGAYECRLHNVNGEASATGKLFVDTTGEDDSDWQ